jgi:magnesium-transporting ATPase (P-type)
VAYHRIDLQEIEPMKIKEEIRTHLSELKRRLPTIREASSINLSVSVEDGFSLRYGDVRDLYIILRGQTLEIILEDDYLRAHISFLLLFCKAIVGFEFYPAQKSALVQLLKGQLASETEKVLVLGDGYNDTAMFQEADVSIELRHEELSIKDAAYPYSGDMIAGSLKQVLDFIEQKAPLLLFDFLYSIKVVSLSMIVYTGVGYLIDCSLSSNQAEILTNSGLTGVYTLVIVPISSLFAALHRRTKSDWQVKTMLTVRENSFQVQQMLRRLLLSVFVKGFLQVIGTFFMIYAAAKSCTHPSGQPYEINVLSAFFLTIITLYTTLHSFSLENWKKWPILLTLNATILVITLLFIFPECSDGSYLGYGFQVMFTTPIWYTLLCFALLLWVLIRTITNTVVELVLLEKKPRHKQRLSDKKYSAYLSSVLRNIFPSVNLIDPIIHDSKCFHIDIQSVV